MERVSGESEYVRFAAVCNFPDNRKKVKQELEC